MRFSLAVWAVTRAVVVAAILAGGHGLASFGNWDGAWYGIIARGGYQQPAQAHSIFAFFPLFPLLSAALMRLNVGWPLAGVIVNNAAFLAALLILYRFVQNRASMAAARWAVVVACVLPYSLFESVAYAEGLFLCFSAAALYACDRERYAIAGIAGALASLARPLGVVLVCAIVYSAIAERRGARVILECAIGFAGIAAFSAWCLRSTGDPLAFLHAQSGWRGPLHFDWVAWWAQLRRDFETLDFRIWRSDGMLWLMLIGGIAAVVAFRSRLGRPAVLFVLASAAVLLLSGTPLSVDRNLSALVPVLAAFGIAAQRFSLAGAAGVALGLPWLAYDAHAFAQFHWVA